MEVDERLLWLISALKAANDSGEVNKEKLLKNISSCFLRIKREKKALSVSASHLAEELQDFQVKAAVLLLLCLPDIRELPNVKNCAEFQSLTSSLPVFSDSIFFTVVRTQKIFLLSPLLSWLPAHVVQTLSREYFHKTNEVTPVTLAITVELLKAILFTSQHCHTSHQSSISYKECLELLVKFLSLKHVSDDTPAMIKFSGYLCMYMFECLYLLLSAHVGSMWTPRTFSCVKMWTELWEKDMSNKETSILDIRETIKSIFMLCQKNNKDVVVHMWMEWSEQMLPQTIEVHANSNQFGKGRSKSIQLVICNVASDVLKVLEAHPQLKEELDTSACQELLQFFHQVAADPDHDPDQDLSLEQLLEEINLKDDRQEKLLGILVQNDGVFTSDDACSCLREHTAALNTQIKLQLLERCIEWVKADKAFNTELKNVVLDLATDLSPEHLNPVIECSLSAGLSETLKTPSFRNQLTAVLNQLADESSAQPSGRHVWLCLQSGRSVVEEAVQQAVTMTGLVPVMVKALADIPQVCHAVLSSGNTLLVTTLMKWQTSGLCDREEQEFISLVKHLLSEEGVLDTQEVMQMMVKPFLVIEGCRNLDKLILPLEILKEVMTQDVDAVLLSGPTVVSLALALTHVLDATVCLEGQGANVLLTLRSLASTILVGIVDALMNSNKKFEKEINLLKQMMGRYNLHPMSVVCLSRVLEAEFTGDRHPDLVLQALVKLPPGMLQEGSSGIPTPVLTRLQTMSKTEWTISLLQLLPHCGESEWKVAFFLIDHALGSPLNVFAVLEVFQVVAYLVCESLAPTPTPLQPEEPDTPTPSPPASLHHFFVFFSSAVMNYLETRTPKQILRQKFLNFGGIFRWWCRVIPSFCCNPELPTLVLARMCAAMEEIMVSGDLKVVNGEHTGTGNATSECVNKGKTESLSEKYVSKIIVHREKIEENQKHREPGSESKAPKVCVNKSESKSFSEKQTSVISIQTAEEAKKKNPDHIRQKKNDGKAHGKAGKCSTPKKERFADQSYIDANTLKKEFEQMTLYMAKYVPASNLRAAVAGKLKKMYDV